ncbi:MAG: thiamine phosphate synthase [Muribaculaceae bacterium]
MKLIAITPEAPCSSPASCPMEVQFLTSILDAGFHFVHVRKPGFTEQQLREYLAAIPAHYHNRLKLHSHFGLASEFAIGGFHLNHRSPTLPTGIDASRYSISRSCHSLDELKAASACHYAFLSPIFDSISKQGYGSAFTTTLLRQFFATHPQCHNAVALGGVTPEHLSELEQCGFAGAAFLGYLFHSSNAADLNKRLTKIKSQL